MISYSLGSFGTISVERDTRSSWYAPSSSEMATLDTHTIAKGVSSLELMERAGRAICREIRSLIQQRGILASGEVIVLCGPGNNGGDGLVIARLLQNEGMRVLAVVADASRYSPECLAQLSQFPDAVTLEGSGQAAMEAANGRCVSFATLVERLEASVIVVDALLGTGQREAPRSGIATLVSAAALEKVRRPSLCVISVDIPTGVNADTGALLSPHIWADVTVSIELVKRGMMQFPAREACGEIVVTPIGIDERSGVEFSLVEGGVVPRLPRRSADSHKGDAGRVLVVGGSAAMPGASALAVLGALRSGAGLVSRTTKPSWSGPSIAAECMNVICSNDSAFFDEGDASEVVRAIGEAHVVVIGPGLGRAPETAAFLKVCLREIAGMRKRIVLDADALQLIAASRLSLKGIDAVITPHPGEAAAMMGISTAEVQADRFASVKKLYESYGAVSLLKGAGTLVWDGSQGGIIARGTPYLGTAGSGDVLSGIIATCLKSCATPFDAAVRGAYIHAVAGERASASSGGPIIASDVAWAAASVVGEVIA